MSDPSPQEIELKLEVAPDDVSRLREHALFCEPDADGPAARRLHSVYFDTPDLDLHAAGLVLRVRREEERCVQTLKSTERGKCGLFVRSEWESEVAGAEPDLSVLPDAVRTRVERVVGDAPLAAVVETDVERTRRRVRWRSSEVFADLDVGVLRTASGDAPISELELELVEGDPGALFQLALELHESVALRPAGDTKADLGFALLQGRGPVPQRGRRPDVAPDASLDDVLAALFAAGLEQMGANTAAACAGADPEGVHQLRVGLRRLRSAFALFRDLLPEEPVRELQSELRWLGRELGPARDLDVFLAETLDPLAARFPDDGSLKRLREAAHELRDLAYERVRSAVHSRRYAELALRLGGFVASRSWRDQRLTPGSARLFAPARESAGALLAERFRRIRRRARTATTAAERHALRIRVKKLRYACEFFASLYPDRHPKRTIRVLSRLQDVLGHLSDRVVAERVLDDVLDHLGAEARAEHQRAAGFVAGWSTRAGDSPERELKKQIRQVRSAPRFWRDDR